MFPTARRRVDEKLFLAGVLALAWHEPSPSSAKAATTRHRPGEHSHSSRSALPVTSARTALACACLVASLHHQWAQPTSPPPRSVLRGFASDAEPMDRQSRVDVSCRHESGMATAATATAPHHYLQLVEQEPPISPFIDSACMLRLHSAPRRTPHGALFDYGGDSCNAWNDRGETTEGRLCAACRRRCSKKRA